MLAELLLDIMVTVSTVMINSFDDEYDEVAQEYVRVHFGNNTIERFLQVLKLTDQEEELETKLLTDYMNARITNIVNSALSNAMGFNDLTTWISIEKQIIINLEA